MAYINVDKFAEKICGFQAIDEDCANKMIWLLRTFPTADVVEVKHGEWLWTETGDEDYEQYWICSVCGEKDYIKSKYCPECGADMRGVKDE